MTERIQTTDELLHADFERVEFAEVKLEKPDPGHYVSGRILDRWNNSDLKLRRNGHTHEVAIASEWSLIRYQPVRSSIEKQMIRDEWNLTA